MQQTMSSSRGRKWWTRRIAEQATQAPVDSGTRWQCLHGRRPALRPETRRSRSPARCQTILPISYTRWAVSSSSDQVARVPRALVIGLCIAVDLGLVSTTPSTTRSPCLSLLSSCAMYHCALIVLVLSGLLNLNGVVAQPFFPPVPPMLIPSQGDVWNVGELRTVEW